MVGTDITGKKFSENAKVGGQQIQNKQVLVIHIVN